MCLLPGEVAELPVDIREGWQSECHLRKDSRQNDCVHMTKGTNELKLKISDNDFKFLDWLGEHPRALFQDDQRQFKITGDGGMNRGNATALAILRGALGPAVTRMPPCLLDCLPMTQANCSVDLLKQAAGKAAA